MVTPLEKARKDPDSMKAKILVKARRIFGQYGFHGATTRMIAEDVGIDISTLYYHWGEKGDLYEAVVLDINEDLLQKLNEVEAKIRGLTLPAKMDVSFDMMTDYLFENPEISNLILFRQFSKTRDDSVLDFRVPELVGDIAKSIGLSKHRKDVPNQTKMLVLCLMNSIHSYVSGEEFFRSILNTERTEYIGMVKQSLKMIFISAFAGTDPTGKPLGERK